MGKPGACPICHRTNDRDDIGGSMCTECTEEWKAAAKYGNGPDSAVWAAERAWKFAGAELEAAIGAARTVEGRAGDPGRSRRRR